MAIRINEELLARAVEAKFRPMLIDPGPRNVSEDESYHHAEVIPVAQPLLARPSLDKDPRAAVIGAVQASYNLLSPQYEQVWAKEFLEERRPADIREHTVELLYGPGALHDRIATFLKWGAVREVKEGKKIKKRGLNATVASYLLAMLDPAKYAFCKPNVYRAAAQVLLGKNEVEYDSIKRILHCTEFYKATLNLLQDRYGFASFTDLMHCHLAFYIMDHYEDVEPTWATLAAWKPKGGSSQKKVGSMENSMKTEPPLNLILYGPPGTGKTYHTIDRAVAICDGQVPTDRRQAVARFGELRNQGRIEFVTFHQSYGYEEFVEGIRPVLADREETSDGPARGGDLGFECPAGVFKRICEAARAGSMAVEHAINVDLSQHRVWKMSLGNTLNPDDADVYDECVAASQIRLGYGMRQDYTGCDDRKAVLDKLRAVKPDASESDYNVVLIENFKNVMKSGDLVIVSDGNLKFRAIGRVTGEYFHLPADSYDQVRNVEWLLVLQESLASEALLRKIFSQRTLYRLNDRVLKTDALRQMLSGKAAQSPTPYVLVIDEINRGNISKIFGELITLIEPDKRLGAENELRVTLPHSREAFGVPANVYVIGTMNTADRSIAFLDTALRRRFRFEELMPSARVIRENVGKNGVIENIDVANVFETINRRIELLYDRDHQIGHSYFLGVRSLADLHDVFQHHIIPLLQEYFHNDWSKVCHVLACPYDADTGEAQLENPLPLIVVESLDGSLGAEADTDVEPRLRYGVNPDVARPPANLRNCFAALLNGPEAAVAKTQEED